MLHPLLRRQLKRLGLADRHAAPTAEPWQRLLERVSRTYTEADQDRYTIERSLTISSEEMQRLYEGLAAEMRILEMIANGSPLPDLLDALARAVEERSEGTLCSILLLQDGHLHHGAAPSLPDSYNEQIDGIVIGPTVGSCGTAADSGKPVIVSDIASDPLWADFRDLALSFGLRACWSTPILSTSGDVLGTFAMYYLEPKEPGQPDRRLIESATHLAAIAIERQRAQHKLTESEATLKATIESTADGILVVKGEGNITYANARFAEMWRIPQDLLETHDDDKLLAFALDQLQDPDAFLAKVRELYQSTEEHSDTLLLKDGRVFDRCSRPLVSGDSVAGRVWNFRDVTERQRAGEQLKSHAEELEGMNQQLVAAHEQLAESQAQLQGYATRLERTVEVEHEQAVTDSLTGLANHRGAHIQLEALVEEANGTNAPLSLILGDIDSFKLFNDTYGHACGDDILKLVADVCREVSEGAAVPCRFGGDEFLIVLPGTDRSTALDVAARVSALLDQREFTTISGDRIPVSLSLGVATMPQDANTVEKLVAAADAAMYDAKRRGRGSRGSHVADALTADNTFGVLDSLVQAIDAKDHYTKRHSDVVADYAAKLAGRLNLPLEAQRALRTAGLLHDVGKLVVPDEVLKKPGPLTADEYELVKRHVTIGEVIIREVPQLDDVIQAVSCHHERFDGAGYPRGLKGKELPLLGRVIAVADAYSAMILDRPYRKALSLDRVVGQLEEGAGRQFDPTLVPVFVNLVQEEAAARRMAA